MADVIKRKRSEKLLVDALFELELEDGTIEQYPIQMTSWNFAELQQKLAKINDNEADAMKKYINIARNDIFKVSKEVKIADKELYYAMEQLMEYIKDISPSFKR